VRQCFVPFVLKLTQAAMAGRGLPRNVAPGGRVVLPWSGGEEAQLVGPDRSVRELAAAGAGKQRYVAVDKARQHGLYRIEGAGASNVAFTVQGEVPEGDLRSLTPEQQERLSAVLGAPVYGGWSAAVQALGSQDAAWPLWPWILVGMGCLYVFETWFVRKV
jgi:hypothetical protein